MDARRDLPTVAVVVIHPSTQDPKRTPSVQGELTEQTGYPLHPMINATGIGGPIQGQGIHLFMGSIAHEIPTHPVTVATASQNILVNPLNIPGFLTTAVVSPPVAIGQISQTHAP